MKELSSRMRAAGWVLRPESRGSWSAVSPLNNSFLWREGTWEPSVEAVIEQLGRDERSIRDREFTPFIGTSRLVNSSDPKEADSLAVWLVREKRVEHHTILRVLSLPDPIGDELLAEAGARKVSSLLQPWPEAEPSNRSFPYQRVLCGHVAEALPPADRKNLYQTVRSHLHPDGEAFFSFYELSALPPKMERTELADGYRFLRGSHPVFLKPYLAGQACKELQKHLGGYAECLHHQFDEFICRWRPDA